MPTCIDCGKWSPPSAYDAVCPACGGKLQSGAALGRLEAEAASHGMTLAEYRDMQHAEREAAREAEERQAERIRDAMEKQGQTVPRHWDHHGTEGDFGQAEGMIFLFFVLPGTALLGAVLLAGFWVLNLPVWVPVLAGVIGVVGGAVLAISLFTVSWLFLDWLAYRSSWVDRNGDNLYFGSVVVAWVLPIAILLAATGILFWIAA